MKLVKSPLPAVHEDCVPALAFTERDGEDRSIPYHFAHADDYALLPAIVEGKGVPTELGLVLFFHNVEGAGVQQRQNRPGRS